MAQSFDYGPARPASLVIAIAHWSSRSCRVQGRPRMAATVAAKVKCLAERNKSEGRGPATKRHENDLAQIPFRGPMHSAGRNDRGYRAPLLRPPARRR